MARPFDLTLYLVTDTLLCAPRSVPEVVAEAVAGGVTAVRCGTRRRAAANCWR